MPNEKLQSDVLGAPKLNEVATSPEQSLIEFAPRLDQFRECMLTSGTLTTAQIRAAEQRMAAYALIVLAEPFFKAKMEAIPDEDLREDVRLRFVEKALGSWHDRHPTAARPYLLTMLNSCHQDALRSRGSRDTQSLDQLLAESPYPDFPGTPEEEEAPFRDAIRSETYGRILKVLDKCTQLTRITLRLSYIEGMSARELAGHLRIQTDEAYRLRRQALREVRARPDMQPLAQALRA